MKVEKLMNAPVVETDRRGIKRINPNPIDNFESAIDESNVVITPVQRQMLKDSQRNRKHMSEVFSELSDKAVVVEQKRDEFPRSKTRNMYTEPAQIEESIRRRKSRLTLEQFMSYHSNKSRSLNEARKKAGDENPIDDAMDVYHFVEKRLFWDSNSGIVNDLPIPKTEVRSIYKKDTVYDDHFMISKPGTRYAENSEVIEGGPVKLSESDIGIVIPEREDSKLAKDLADYMDLDFELIKLPESKKLLYPVTIKGETTYPASYICVIKMSNRDARQNLADWANFSGIDIPQKYLKVAINQIKDEDRKEELKTNLGITKKTYKKRKKTEE